jgi:hypothetical protein
MATIGVIWFSYKPDGGLLLESLRAAKRTFEKTAHDYIFTVVDDGMYPLDRSVRKRIEDEYNVVYVRTFYPRCGNLLGPDNIAGQTKAMADAGNFCDVLVKCDCDTMLLKLDWVEALLDPEEDAVMVGSYKGLKNYPMGNCYAIRTEGGTLLRRLAKDVEKFPAWTQCFEDYEVGTRIHRLMDGDDGYTIRWRSGMEDGFWLCNPQEVDSRAKEARVVSCGFGWTACPPKDRAAYKEAQLKTMTLLNDDIEGKLVHPQAKDGPQVVEENANGTT